MKKRRKSIQKQEKESKSRTICAAFAALDSFVNATTVCVYMDAFNEVETSYIIDECKKQSKTIVVPVVEGDDIYLSPLTETYRKGAFGIREPMPARKFSKDKVDIFAVPALAFDLYGGRVGFGRGYYDKLLKETAGMKVGLCYEFQVVDFINCESHDILMDYIITEGQVICCGKE